jgi:hypothetical protein
MFCQTTNGSFVSDKRQLSVLLMQIKPRSDVWASKISLTLPHFTEVPVQRQKSGRQCVFMLDISILT